MSEAPGQARSEPKEWWPLAPSCLSAEGHVTAGHVTAGHVTGGTEQRRF